MTRIFDRRLRGTGAVAALAAVLALSGCNPASSPERSQATYGLPNLPATFPLAPGGPTNPDFAPAVAALPRAPLIQAVQIADRNDNYAYADDAWGYSDAIDYAPPDYGFDYDGIEPWAWQGYDDSRVFVEPLDDGYRYYYYRSGYDYPYYVRDPDWGYGYDSGRLAVVYDRYGALVPYSDYGPRHDYASRYYSRGRALYRASHQRHPVIAGNWAARQDMIAGARTQWAEQRTRQQAWQDYHQRVERQQARYWQGERTRRQADAVRFATWRDDGFRTASPPRAIPAGWTRAKWASDERRFAPPAAGFDGAPTARRQAVAQERARVLALAPRRPALETRDRAVGARRDTMVQGARDRVGDRQAFRSEGRPGQIEGKRESVQERRVAADERRQKIRARQSEARPAAARERATAAPERAPIARQAQGRSVEAVRQRQSRQAERRQQAQRPSRSEIDQRGARLRRETKAPAQAQSQARNRQTEARVKNQARPEARQRRREEARATIAQARQPGPARSEARNEAQTQRRAQADQRRQAQDQARATRKQAVAARAEAPARPERPVRPERPRDRQ